MKLYTIAQTAELLAVSTKTVRKLVDGYALEAVDLRQGNGKRLLRIPETAVDRYIRSSAIIPATTKAPRPAGTWRLERRRA